jgi:hypothetical protein
MTKNTATGQVKKKLVKKTSAVSSTSTKKVSCYFKFFILDRERERERVCFILGYHYQLKNYLNKVSMEQQFLHFHVL